MVLTEKRSDVQVFESSGSLLIEDSAPMPQSGEYGEK
jgi:hypothetical protein